MWTEQEMREVVSAFKEVDIERERLEVLKNLQNIELLREMSTENFRKACIWGMMKTIGIIVLDIAIFVCVPEKTSSISSILFFTGTFISAQKEVIDYLRIEATDTDKYNRLYQNKINEYIQKYGIEKRKPQKKYILDKDSIIKEDRTASRRKRLIELYNLKEQMISQNVEINSQKVL